MSKRIGSDMNTMFSAELSRSIEGIPESLDIGISAAINNDHIFKFSMYYPTSKDLDKMIEELISVRNDLIVYENRLKK